MEKILVFIIMSLLALLIVSIYISKSLLKHFPSTKKKTVYSKRLYDKYCKQREEVLNNIPITFDSHCNLKTESDIYYFYDSTVEKGIEKLKKDGFSIGFVGRV